MKHYRSPAVRLYHTVFDISRIVLYYTKGLIMWLRQAWVTAWQDVFDMLGRTASLLLNRQIWAITLLVGIVWVAVIAPPLFKRAVNIDEWQMTPCNLEGVHIFVNAPRSVAPGDRRYFEITVQNETDRPLRNVRVSVKSNSGLLLFDETNTVTIETLGRNGTSTRVLHFRVANLQTFEEISTVVAYDSESEAEQLESHYCSETPVLANSTWRRMLVQLKAAPDVLGAGATYIGYLGTLITGLLAITGKIGPVVRGVISILRSSSPQANGQSSLRNQKGDVAGITDSGSAL